MKNKVQYGARFLLGLVYVVFGLNGFFQFLPQPPLPEAATNFFVALLATGYFFPVLKAAEVLGGAMLLGGVAAPLALVILAPITLQIFLFHHFLTPGLENSIVPLVMICLHVTAAMAFWPIYAPLFRRHRTVK